MKDVTGKELQVGQTVVTMFDEYAQLTICEVVKISKQKVGLVLKDADTAAPITQIIMQKVPHLKVRYKFPNQVAII